MKRKAAAVAMSALFMLLWGTIAVFGQAATGGEEPPQRQVDNAAYLNSYWFSGAEPLTDEQMKERVLGLQQYRIRYQLADVGMLVSNGGATNGTLPEGGYAELARWMKATRENAPDQRVVVTVSDGTRYAWQDGRRVSNPTFGNDVYNANLRAVADKFVNQGIPYEGKLYKADGIHLDIEGFLPDDAVLLKTARHVRTVLNDEAIFSIAAPTDAAVWSDAYIREIAGVFNMIHPMMYDQMGWGSPVDSPETYRRFWETTIVRYARAIAQSARPSVKLVPTMPAYEKKTAEDGTVYHDPAVEHIANAAAGLKLARDRLALERTSDPRIDANGVHGAGIFWWSTFILEEPDPRDGHDYAPDRQSWMDDWVRHQ
ncbi:glycoside hydrolase family 18 protein [Paenibacillus sp. GYB003]|uniref:glycoside hydrolase family 18 protein n=1 Tax=Paenibacillus sp. GYB003 TaxID=2994392 RepID=UPI002F96BF74